LLAHVRQIVWLIEEEMTCLHNEDIISMKLWIDKIEQENTCVFLKDKITQPPLSSNLDTEAFVICMQTSFQVDTFWCLGDRFIGIDATHNVTQYPSFLLFTIVVRDQWGHGI